MDVELSAGGKSLKVTGIGVDNLRTVITLWNLMASLPTDEPKLGSVGFVATTEQGPKQPVYAFLGDGERPLVK